MGRHKKKELARIEATIIEPIQLVRDGRLPRGIMVEAEKEGYFIVEFLWKDNSKKTIGFYVNQTSVDWFQQRFENPFNFSHMIPIQATEIIEYDENIKNFHLLY